MKRNTGKDIKVIKALCKKLSYCFFYRCEGIQQCDHRCNGKFDSYVFYVYEKTNNKEMREEIRKHFSI